MKKIILISLIGILITAFSYAQSKRKYTDTAIQVDASNPNLNGLNTFFSEGWKFKNATPQVVSVSESGGYRKGWILVILTKPLKTKEDE